MLIVIARESLEDMTHLTSRETTESCFVNDGEQYCVSATTLKQTGVI